MEKVVATAELKIKIPSEPYEHVLNHYWSGSVAAFAKAKIDNASFLSNPKIKGSKNDPVSNLS
ncbi:hypothetical protein [Nonlabens xiamenensis]|uniref:hypothetical protein n=1 Tax=Nonlabens xiamenensis TaxID=2341043 RepID=UPI000F613EDC|nr:hypothetical protein [Nonlabens xiamenensis]